VESLLIIGWMEAIGEYDLPVFEKSLDGVVTGEPSDYEAC
jgi:hypothetical protein